MLRIARFVCEDSPLSRKVAYISTLTPIYTYSLYGAGTSRRTLKIIGLSYKRALWKRRYSAKETYNFKQPTNRSHPIARFARGNAITKRLKRAPYQKSSIYTHTYTYTYYLHRMAVMHMMPYICRSFFAKEPYNWWLFCGKWPTNIMHLRHRVACFLRRDANKKSYKRCFFQKSDLFQTK